MTESCDEDEWAEASVNGNDGRWFIVDQELSNVA